MCVLSFAIDNQTCNSLRIVYTFAMKLCIFILYLGTCFIKEVALNQPHESIEFEKIEQMQKMLTYTQNNRKSFINGSPQYTYWAALGRTHCISRATKIANSSIHTTVVFFLCNFSPFPSTQATTNNVHWNALFTVFICKMANTVYKIRCGYSIPNASQYTCAQ